MVTRASISNIGTLYKKGLFIGSTVSIKKSGEIIPYITGLCEKSPHHEKYLKLFEETYLKVFHRILKR
jgi:NAD-dependent DNA ligase